MSALPASAVKANEDTLSQALAATHISEQETQDATEDKKEVAKDGDKDELEEGEIDEEEEEDDGTPKTVFDSARKFNLKVRLVWSSTNPSTHSTRNGPCTLTLRSPRTCKRPTRCPIRVSAAGGSMRFGR